MSKVKPHHGPVHAMMSLSWVIALHSLQCEYLCPAKMSCYTPASPLLRLLLSQTAGTCRMVDLLCSSVPGTPSSTTVTTSAATARLSSCLSGHRTQSADRYCSACALCDGRSSLWIFKFPKIIQGIMHNYIANTFWETKRLKVSLFMLNDVYLFLRIAVWFRTLLQYVWKFKGGSVDLLIGPLSSVKSDQMTAN